MLPAVLMEMATRNGRPTIARLAPIFQSVRTGFLRAMDAAINLATSFDAVTDYFAITMGTSRRQHVNRAFEAVKGPSFTTGRNLKRLVVIVSANIALSHNVSWLKGT
jgi:hypothetical protein